LNVHLPYYVSLINQEEGVEEEEEEEEEEKEEEGKITHTDRIKYGILTVP
jgi:hypothetical protein